jgi:spore coat polysaccharide biosynthesis predicted glycosyltransferase SpsG/RimJ/RimL family protein N-acetyltransferase
VRILLRCDGGPGIGVGHVVRSLALAEEATARGHHVTIAGRLSGALLDGLVGRSEAEVISDAPLDATVLAQLADGYDVLHVDHYGVAAELRARMESTLGGRPARPVLSSMVDGDFGLRDCDLAVASTPTDPGTFQHRDAAWVLRGPKYLPLRRAVRDLGASVHAGAGAATRVVVVMGGADPHSLTPAVVDALGACGLDLEVEVVCTPTTRASLVERSRDWQDRLRVVEPGPDLPRLMAAADLVISAAGTSTWELASMHTPMALVLSVDNQRPGYTAMVTAGAAVGLGGIEDVMDRERTAGTLRDVLVDPDRRRSMAARAAGVVDGLGAWRIVSAWEAIVAGARPGLRDDHLTVRPATLDDAALLLGWRNDSVTREVSRSSELVTWDEHLAWLSASLRREDRMLLVAEEGGDGPRRPVGTVRWDRDDGTTAHWEVSITVAPERRGEGMARPLLHAGERYLLSSQPATDEETTFVAVVHEDNTPSAKLFAASGYLPYAPRDGGGWVSWAKHVVWPGPAAR